MEIISLITSVLAIVLVLLNQFFGWRARKRAAIKADEEQAARDQKIIESVLDRLKHLAKDENTLVNDVENRVDAELRRRGPGST